MPLPLPAAPTEQVDDAVVVAGEQQDEVAEQEHEGRVHDAVRELVGRAVELEQRVHLVLQHGQRLEQLLGRHAAQRAFLLSAGRPERSVCYGSQKQQVGVNIAIEN